MFQTDPVVVDDSMIWSFSLMKCCFGAFVLPLLLPLPCIPFPRQDCIGKSLSRHHWLRGPLTNEKNIKILGFVRIVLSSAWAPWCFKSGALQPSAANLSFRSLSESVNPSDILAIHVARHRDREKERERETDRQRGSDKHADRG